MLVRANCLKALRVPSSSNRVVRSISGFKTANLISNNNQKLQAIRGQSSIRSFSSARRLYAAPSNLHPSKPETVEEKDWERITHLRNIGISAHIDSGKTTLTERFLYYTGRIKEIHEVRGKDNVGAKMDWMDLEREKGITIQSAATYCRWGDHSFNIIDTPGHIDFTIEVERALRVLDGAVLVLCAVSGVQSQTITVDRQMKRYHVPRICFVNKMDRQGSNPFRIAEQLRSKLRLNASLIQIPIGKEENFEGVVDLIRMKAIYNQGYRGNEIIEKEVPEELKELAIKTRKELIEQLANVDEEIGELFLMEEEPTEDQIQCAIRRATIARTFVPVLMGSAFKDKSVQPLLDAVVNYLPNPSQVTNTALDVKNKEQEINLIPQSNEPFVGLAFKLEEGRFGQLTYIRVYQGRLAKGEFAIHAKTGKRIKIARLVRMHSNDMEDVDEVGAGEICALFGVECASGDTFTDGKMNVSMTSMFVPDPVISLSLIPKTKETINFSKALNRFQKEDPTFRVHLDAESGETIISGMGELHLDVYVERMKREYGVECETGKPQVAFRETITKKVEFNYTHKKQSGGAGQFARVIGYIEPIVDPEAEVTIEFDKDGKPITPPDHVFEEEIFAGAIPENYIPSVEKGLVEAMAKGPLTGHRVKNIKMVLQDGLTHVVDSSEMAFRTAGFFAFREAFEKAGPILLEPIMRVEISCPVEFQGNVMGSINRRKGVISDSETHVDYFSAIAEVPLNNMFGYSTELRSATQGKGEFSMEYKQHSPVNMGTQKEMVEAFLKAKAKGNKK